MNAKRTSHPAPARASVARRRRRREDRIERTSARELPGLPADFWSAAKAVPARAKQPISLRVDPDVLAWFKRQGPRYQSRMNAVLRAYMAGMQARRKSRGAARAGR